MSSQSHTPAYTFEEIVVIAKAAKAARAAARLLAQRHGGDDPAALTMRAAAATAEGIYRDETSSADQITIEGMARKDGWL